MSIQSNSKLAAVDLFCGAGGLTHGLVRAGVPVVAGIDLDPNCRYPFVSNNKSKFLLEDVSNVKGKDLLGLYPKNTIRILVGCAPCQPFSQYSRKTSQHSSKWGLLEHFSRLVRETKPMVLSMENVPGLTKHSVYREFSEGLKSLGYFVTSTNVYCPNYGIPQQRTRLVLFASLKGELDILPPTHKPEKYRTVRQVIQKLPQISSGQVDSKDPLHRACKLSDLNLSRLRASKPGGHWRDWPEELIAACHKSDSGKNYLSVYGRMEWDQPSPTITTQFYGFGNGRFGHPDQDRAITLREGSLLQSFPKSYRFCPKSGEIRYSVLGRLIGNAVPVKLGEIIGISIRNHLGGISG